MSRFIAPVNTYTPNERSPVLTTGEENVPRGVAPAVVEALSGAEGAIARDETQRWTLRAARDKLKTDRSNLEKARDVAPGAEGVEAEGNNVGATALVEAALRAKVRALDGTQSFPGQSAGGGGRLTGRYQPLGHRTNAVRSWADVVRGSIPPDFPAAGAAAVFASRGGRRPF